MLAVVACVLIMLVSGAIARAADRRAYICRLGGPEMAIAIRRRNICDCVFIGAALIALLCIV